MEAPLRVFIGWDDRQPVSYNVLQHSINRAASRPVSICALNIEQLPIKRVGLTPFTWTRFLVPWLCDYDGWALFLDADMVLNADIAELFALANERHAVMVADLEAKFERASLMLFNCGHEDNRVLTPEFVDTTDVALHKIAWTENVGYLPSEWNHCVFYDEPREDVSLVHYTAGVPVFPEVHGCEHTDLWIGQAKESMSAVSWAELMGRSVHVQKVVDWHNAKKAGVPANGQEPPASGGDA